MEDTAECKIVNEKQIKEIIDAIIILVSADD
ncbi:MAG: hypothetical protein H6Q73_1218 [Firmicutes bacterium]|nr:hypothetical protein [Bacillota bacterium]